MEIIKISTPFIKLNQFLKLAGITDTGGQTSFLLADKYIKLNGAQVFEKRKKIYPEDILSIEGYGSFKVVKE